MRNIIRHYPDNSYLYRPDDIPCVVMLHNKGRDIACFRVKLKNRIQ